MVNRPKAIGTAGETAVVRYLRDSGWPSAERRALAGTYDLGDIIGTPGVVWEVKAGQAAKTASDGQVATWLVETTRERHNARADFGVLVMARGGIGAPRAGEWWAVLNAESMWELVAYAHDRPLNIPPIVFGKPVRIHLATACTLLRAAGYGDPL